MQTPRIFSPSDWHDIFPDVPEEDIGLKAFPLSADDLAAPCPFFPAKLVRDTHVAFFVPKRIRGISTLDLRSLHSLEGNEEQVQRLLESEAYRFADVRESAVGHGWHVHLADPVEIGADDARCSRHAAGYYRLPTPAASYLRELLMRMKYGSREKEIFFPTNTPDTPCSIVVGSSGPTVEVRNARDYPIIAALELLYAAPRR